MRLVRFAPNLDVANFDNVVNKFFNSRSHSLECSRDETAYSSHSPAVDVRENDAELEFTVELPGLEKSEIDISLNNGVLNISGERSVDEANREQYRRAERWHGRFHRSFRLPDTVDAGKIEANLSNGLLRIKLPRKEEALPRQISVTVS